MLAVGDCAANGPAVHLARMANRLAKQVTVYTDGHSEFADELEPILAQHGFKIDKRPIRRLARGEGEAEVVLSFDTGADALEGFMVWSTRQKIQP